MDYSWTIKSPRSCLSNEVADRQQKGGFRSDKHLCGHHYRITSRNVCYECEMWDCELYKTRIIYTMHV